LLILAFETSAKAGSVALMREGVLLAESYCNTGMTHSQTIMPMAQELLHNCGYTPEDVQAVAVAAGPGSFTGVRIGVAAAKGFTWARQIPCYGVSTLEAMAYTLGLYEGCCVCAMDARRNQVYNAVFRFDKGVPVRVCEDRAISLDALSEHLKTLEGPFYLVGDGSNLCHSHIPGLILPPEHRMHQRASGVALAAQAAITRGETGDGAALVPNYLRLSQAERERLAREQK
jgi:tRNA threonylcarbamoyladenosine biosynthesis protein TsaB